MHLPSGPKDLRIRLSLHDLGFSNQTHIKLTGETLEVPILNRYRKVVCSKLPGSAINDKWIYDI